MLDTRFDFPFEAEDAFNLRLARCSNWGQSKKRVLIIQQTVDSRDLKAQAMLGDKGTMTCMKNAIKYARSVAKTYKETSTEASYIVAPFNRKRHLHLSKQAKGQAESEFAASAHKLIQKVKPTHILVCGDQAFHAMWPSIEHAAYKRGWVFDLKSGDLDVKVTPTLDFARLLEKDGEHANLLGFWCRHLANLMLGKDPHNLSHIKTEPRYVGTVADFDKLMKVLRKSKVISTDTETKNLSVNFNAIYTIQFATELNPTVGYVLPLRHPMTPWTTDELKYIKRELKKFFSAPATDKELVFFSGAYDLRVIRREFKIPLIWHKAWEITSGEHLLDENISELSQVGSALPGGLAAVYCSYGNDFYMTAQFSKKDRSTTGNVKPDDHNFMLYGGTDVVSLLHIRLAQIAKASHQTIDGHNYQPYFVRHMLHQMSDTVHQLSHLREDGSLVDAKYLKFLTSNESPLRKEMKVLSNAFRAFPQAVKANERVVADSGLKAKGLFGKIRKTVNWALSLSKPSHLRTLFFEEMELKPVSQTDGGEPAVDKEFIAAYKDKEPIVAAYGEYNKLAKLLSTYARGWYKKLRSNVDSAFDNFLRPEYSVFDVTTGRLASKNPSLQTIPSRGKLVKIIKRMFPAPKGTLLIRYDYSAHEVRVWSYVSLDKVLAEIFKVGQKLRQLFIQDPSEANKKAVKEKGDIHILNVKRLLNKVIDKSHPLRDAIKCIIFGLLYGKSAATLGEDTKLGDKMALLEIIGNSEVSKADRIKAEQTLRDLIAEDRTGYAQGLIDKIFQEFKAGGKWTTKMKRLAEEAYHVFSPTGRIRHLYAAMTGDRRIVSQQVRRGSNAPIQGLASEIGVKAGRVIMETYHKELPVLCNMLGLDYKPWALRIPFNRMVHDANYYSVVFPMVIPFIHILQYQATYGITKAYKDEFNFEFTVEPEIEIEVGVRDDLQHKWDWSLPNIVECLLQSVAEAEANGMLEIPKEQVIKQIFKPWANKKTRRYLQQKYPLLNVSNLDKQIIDAIKPIYRR